MTDRPDLDDVARTPYLLEARGASLRFGPRVVWEDLDLGVRPGEFLTVLGSNGSGKSSLLKAILGLQPLSSGSITLRDRPVARGDRHIGYVPQQRLFGPGTPIRGRDLVALGVDGHRPGVRLRGRRATRAKVDAALAAVGGEEFASRPVGQLSGGEQQRVRVAQALVSDPALLLCDEPLISLDLHHQRSITELIDQRRRTHHTPVVFVTHDVNPVLGMTDRVLYLAAGSYRIGHPGDILRSEVLTELYGTPVEVARVGGRVVVLGAPTPHDPEHPHHVTAYAEVAR